MITNCIGKAQSYLFLKCWLFLTLESWLAFIYSLGELRDFRRLRRMLHIKVETKKSMIPVRIAYLRPRFTSRFTRRPASTTPQKLAVIVGQNGMSRIEAMMAPVQAPVPGKGTATKSMSPSHWNSSTGPAFSLALLNSISSIWDP